LSGEEGLFQRALKIYLTRMEPFDNEEILEGQQFYSWKLVPRSAPLAREVRLTAGKRCVMGREPRIQEPGIKEPRFWG
jgi:hypothetical protein